MDCRNNKWSRSPPGVGSFCSQTTGFVILAKLSPRWFKYELEANMLKLFTTECRRLMRKQWTKIDSKCKKIIAQISLFEKWTGAKKEKLLFLSYAKLEKILCMSIFTKWIRVALTYSLLILCSYKTLIALCKYRSDYMRAILGRGQFLFSLSVIWTKPEVSFEVGGILISNSEM